MKVLILTSSIDVCYKDENEVRIPQNFGNTNGILDTLRKYIDKFDNFLYIASSDNYEITDVRSAVWFKSFDLTMPFKNYRVLDSRTKNQTKELIENADFILLCGGHLPTQNKLFEELNIREYIRNTNAVVCGASAGSMNSASNVYCPPELEGEALDPDFQKFYKGLGLTEINVFPHFDEIKYLEVDGKQNLNDFIIPDSYDLPILCLNEGSYIVVKDDSSTVFGESYIASNGKLTQICKDNESVILSIK